MARCQIPFSFSTPTGGVLAPVVGTTVLITNRTTSSQATVYVGETGAPTIALVQTDAGGNVPGWCDEGSYKIVASSQGAFGGATINWEAVRGDGVSKIAPGAVGLAQLTAAVAQALVPTGAILDYAGPNPPVGFVACDGSVYAQVGTYAALFAVVGTTYNTGGEGAGNFRIPDSRQRFTLGKGVSGTGSTLGEIGGAIDHTHSVPALTIPSLTIPALTVNPASIPALQVNSHTHPLGGSGGAAVRATGYGGYLNVIGGGYGPSFYSSGYAYVESTQAGNSGSSKGWQSSYPLLGTTELGAVTTQGNSTGYTNTVASSTGGGTTGTGTTGTTNPAYLTTTKIIKI